VPEDEHQITDTAGDELILDALILEKVEGRIDEMEGS
jgi:hypothetical protein